jgi:UDP:flavonoid glycosyltransferase YjiC (YdhE family)
MYALFTAVPITGHLDPLLRQAEALQRRGHRTAFVDLGPPGPMAERLRDAQAAAFDEPYARGTQRIADAVWDLWPSMFDDVAAAIAADRPDIVVADLACSAGMSAAEAAGVPFVVNNPGLVGAISPKILPVADHLPFPHSGRSVHEIHWWHLLAEPFLRKLTNARISRHAGGRLNRLRAEKHLPSVDVHEWLRDRQILVNGAFELEYERPLPANVAMVGAMLPEHTPALPADLTAWLDDGVPVVYVDLGPLPPARGEQIAAALTHEAFRVLWKSDASSLALLSHPNVGVFVSDCRVGSVYDALHAGKPIVGIPLLAEQRDMAVRVADAGLGVRIDKRRLTAEELRADVLRMLRDEEGEFRVALPRMQRDLARAGGVERAADLIERQGRGGRS